MAVAQASSMVPPTVAQQIFIVGSSVATIFVGMAMAKEFSDSGDVPMPLVTGTTIISVLCTLGAGLYLARKGRGVF